jgi:hypothetical protein
MPRLEPTTKARLTLDRPANLSLFRFRHRTRPTPDGEAFRAKAIGMPRPIGSWSAMRELNDVKEAAASVAGFGFDSIHGEGHGWYCSTRGMIC